MGCGSSNAASPPSAAPTPAPAPTPKPTLAPAASPPPPLPTPSSVETPKDELVAANNDLIANQVARDLADAKNREAAKLEEEANQAAADAIALQIAEDLANKQIEEARALGQEANEAAAEAIANQMAADLAQKQIEEARLKEAEANNAAAEAIALDMAADLAKKQMEEANALEGEANKAAADAIADQMAADLAQKRMEEEAQLKETEANQAAAEAIANQMALEFAEQKKAEAEAAEKAEKEANEQQLMEMMKTLGAKQRFRVARENGSAELMEEAGAEIVQGCWRKKVARRNMELKKIEKLRLQQEYAARKFQSLFRIRMARRKVIALREEKVRILKEKSARKLQSRYRTRLARKKVVAIREEKIRLLREASARRLQATYRSRLAQKKVVRLRQEKQQLMEVACARKLQAKYRTHMARKKVNRLRLQKRSLMEEGYARKIQCRYRARLARKKVKQLKAQRDKLLEEAAAIKFQCAYRARLARRKVNLLRSQRGLPPPAVMEEAVIPEKTSILVQKLWRGLKARRAVATLLRENHPHTLILSLKSAAQINSGDRSAPDPYVIAAAYSLASRTRGKSFQGVDSKPVLTSKKSRRGSAIQGPASDTMTLLSYAQSKSASGTVNPVWNEDLLITGASWNSQIILTVVDRNVRGKVTILGQKVIEIKHYPRLYHETTIDFDLTNLDSYLIRVQDPLGKDLVPVDTVPLPPAGTISFSLRLPPLAYAMCGWVMRESEGALTRYQMKRRWMILFNGMLVYYEDQFTLNDRKGVLFLDEVTSMTPIQHKEGPAIVLTHGPNPTDKWTIMWDPNEPPRINQMWERKLKRWLQKEVVAAFESSSSATNSKK